MPKILHIADLHLDSRFVGFSATDAAKRRNELRDVFKKALAFAKNEGCVLTLISGDLFDGEFYTSDTLKFLSECFSCMPEHKFVITPGNHDPFTASSPYRRADFPSNVFVFDDHTLSRMDFDDIGITVYGYAFTSDYYGKDPLDGFSIAPTTDNFVILCAHTELDTPLSSYAPISSAALAASGLDYAALGHIHKSTGVKKAGSTVYAYSGCLAGRDFSEDGEKGGIIVSLERIGKAKSVNATPVRLCPWVYSSVSVSVTGLENESAVTDAVTKKLRSVQKDSTLEHITRVILDGETALTLEKERLLAKLLPLGVRQIKDETVFAQAGLDLDNDYSLRGEFYRTLKPMLCDTDPQKRRLAAQALKYGLTALGGGHIEI